MLGRLYNRLFICPKWGHTPCPPVGGSHGYLSDICLRCGTNMDAKWFKR